MPYNDLYRAYRPIPNIKPHPSHRVECNGHHRKRITTVPISRCPTINYVLTTPLRKTVNTVKRSVPYLYPDAKQQTTSQPHGCAQRPLSNKDEYRTYLSMKTSKQRPNHPVGCNSHYRTRFSTAPISRRPTTNHSPTIRFRTTVTSVQRSVTYSSPDSQQHTTSRSLCYLQRSIL